MRLAIGSDATQDLVHAAVAGLQRATYMAVVWMPRRIASEDGDTRDLSRYSTRAVVEPPTERIGMPWQFIA